MKKKVGIETHRRVFPHTYLYEAACNAFEIAKNPEQDAGVRFSQNLAVMLFCAFCLEAYMNFLGSKFVQYWDRMERCLSPKQKLELICEIIGFSLNGLKDKRPFQTFTDAFQFRTQSVHAKPVDEDVVIKLHSSTDSSDNGEILVPFDPQVLLTQISKTSPTWLDEVAGDQAERFLEDTCNIIKILHSHAGLKGDPLSVRQICSI